MKNRFSILSFVLTSYSSFFYYYYIIVPQHRPQTLSADGLHKDRKSLSAVGLSGCRSTEYVHREITHRVLPKMYNEKESARASYCGVSRGFTYRIPSVCRTPIPNQWVSHVSVRIIIHTLFRRAEVRDGIVLDVIKYCASDVSHDVRRISLVTRDQNEARFYDKRLVVRTHAAIIITSVNDSSR